ACEQTPSSAPLPPDLQTHVQEIGPRAARAIALAMAEAPVRVQLLADFRDSPFSEHKVVLQDYLRSPSGTKLLGAMERAGIDSKSLSTALQGTGPIQFYVPVTSH